MYPLKVEDRLLFSCLKNNSPLELNSDCPPLDWGYFLKRGKKERIEPLIYNYLKEKRIWPSIPAEVRETLKNSYYRTARDNMVFSYELNRILESFSREGIALVLLKSIPMIEDLYGNIALRASSDIDLLIRPEDFERARRALETAGFFNTQLHPEEFRKDNIEVDLHWHLSTVRVKSRLKALEMNLRNIWRRARSINIEGQEVLVPAASDLLIYLSLHLTFQHGLQGLRWLVDIARLLERYGREIDWQELVKEIKVNQLQWPVYATLYATVSLLEVELPPWILEELRPRRFGLVEGKLKKIGRGAGESETLKFFLTFLSLPFSTKISLLAELLYPSPATLRSLYYLEPARPVWPFYFSHWQRLISSLCRL